jgi:hypothetical protein
VDVHSRHPGSLGPHDGDVGAAVSGRQAMKACGSPVGSDCPTPGCETSCQDHLFVRLPGAGYPVNTLMDSLPGSRLKPCPDGTVGQPGSNHLRTGKQTMLPLRKRSSRFHASSKTRGTDSETGVSEVS